MKPVYEIRERHYTKKLIHHVVVRTDQKTEKGFAYANKHLAEQHVKDLNK